MNDDKRLKDDRMIFYSEEIPKIEAILKELVKLSAASCALLVDKDGHLVVRTGSVRSFDVDTISALVAGSFAATREMARLLGESEFSVMFHQGQRDNIQLNLVGDRTILTVIFDDQTTLGMVRLYASEAGRKLVELFETMRSEEGEEGRNLPLTKEFEDGANARLDSLFK